VPCPSATILPRRSATAPVAEEALAMILELYRSSARPTTKASLGLAGRSSARVRRFGVAGPISGATSRSESVSGYRTAAARNLRPAASSL
jgi:hypothetical protein